MRTTRPFNRQKLLQHLSFENLGGEELDLEGEGGGRGGGGAGRGEDGSGHLPSSVGLLELHKPLIGCHAVARAFSPMSVNHGALSLGLSPSTPNPSGSANFSSGDRSSKSSDLDLDLGWANELLK
jgi:hypothetical protein